MTVPEVYHIAPDGKRIRLFVREVAPAPPPVFTVLIDWVAGVKRSRKALESHAGDHPDRLARFEREAQLLASVNHGNIAHVYGLVDLPPEGGSYTGMGFVMDSGEPRFMG